MLSFNVSVSNFGYSYFLVWRADTLVMEYWTTGCQDTSYSTDELLVTKGEEIRVGIHTVSECFDVGIIADLNGIPFDTKTCNIGVASPSTPPCPNTNAFSYNLIIP